MEELQPEEQLPFEKPLPIVPARTAGRLKIFFGYCAGVGKTYAMLEAAHRAKQAGVDLVVGYIEPHTRPETLQLLSGLEVLEPSVRQYRGISLREFDLDRALERKPQIILVDELAHTNAEGSRHVKRYQDVEELLRAGINVYTTVNVQHLESLNDMVSSITGVMVSERIPDSIFDTADQVELVDIEPQELLERLRSGKIYRPEQAQQALQHFFNEGNLVALREIALRRTADRLGRAPAGAAGQRAKVGEAVMVCLSSAPSNAKVLRMASRLAEAFHSEFTALYVQTPDLIEDEAARRRLQVNLRLAEELGAKISTVYGDDPAVQIAEYARASGVCKIVLGRSLQRRGLLVRKKNLVDRLSALAPDLDIYIIPDQTAAHRPAQRRHPARPALSLRDLGKMLAILAVCTLIGLVFTRLGFTAANAIMVYILGVLLIAMTTSGRSYSLLASALSVLIFNFFFTSPYFTLFSDPSYIATFGVMFVVALLGSSMTIRIKRQAIQSAQKAYRTQVLLQTSQKLQKAEQEEAILAVTAVQLQKLLDCSVLLYPVSDSGDLGTPLTFALGEEQMSKYLTLSEQAVAQWVSQNNKHAGATTNTLPSAQCLYMALRGTGQALAVAGIAIGDRTKPDAFEKNLMVAILDECGLALEKQRLLQAKQKVEQTAKQEALRANLLRAISHDLRTPLTSISGNAGILMENSRVLNETKKQELYRTIYDDAMWLVNLVENLLSVTRIDNGSMHLRLEPELLQEVFQEALNHLDRQAEQYSIRVELPDDMLMAQMDAKLIVQVVINIVNNAVKYTPPGSHITLSAQKREQMVQICIADDGPGISDEAKEKLFEMFYTVGNDRGDGRRGLGLGLSLCKSIILAHGGAIWVEDNHPKGCSFYFTRPILEETSHE